VPVFVQTAASLGRVLVQNSAKMPEIERNVIAVLRNQHDRFANNVSDAYLIKDIGLRPVQSAIMARVQYIAFQTSDMIAWAVKKSSARITVRPKLFATFLI